MKVFQKYADYYDKIYKEKDYKKETEFLKKIIKKYSSLKVRDILSLGCGTASHDLILTKDNFKITGVDRSKKMIQIAKEKTKKENLDIEFKIADITNFKIEKKFDFAMAMFNIMGYMTENKAVEKMLRNVRRALKKNALFVFDCWYGPAVLKSRPEDRIKVVGKNGKKIIRKTRQKLDIEKSIIDITFEILEKKDSGWKEITRENHRMRFWYLPELEYFLNKNGFTLIKTCNFLRLNSSISENNWNIFVIAQKL